MRYLFLLGLLVAAGCSSSKTDDAAKKAGDAVKAAGASAASAASTAATSVASAAKKAVESKAPASPAAPAGMAAPAGLLAVWKADVDAMTKAMMADPKFLAASEEQRKQGLAMAKKMLPDMTMEFTKDGKMVMSLGPQMRQEGTYAIKSVNGKNLVIEGVLKGNTQTLNAVLDGNRLNIKIDGSEMILTK